MAKHLLVLRDTKTSAATDHRSRLYKLKNDLGLLALHPKIRGKETNGCDGRIRMKLPSVHRLALPNHFVRSERSTKRIYEDFHKDETGVSHDDVGKVSVAVPLVRRCPTFDSDGSFAIENPCEVREFYGREFPLFHIASVSEKYHRIHGCSSK